jgi:hypothetical protein
VDADRQAIQQRGILVGDAIGQVVDILLRRLRQLAEAATPGHADVLEVRTKVVLAGAAGHAGATGHQRFDRHAVAGLHLRDIRRHLDHPAAELMAKNLAADAGQDLRHAPGDDVHVAAADAGDRGADEHLTRSHDRLWHLAHVEHVGLDKDRGAHHFRPPT